MQKVTFLLLTCLISNAWAIQEYISADGVAMRPESNQTYVSSGSAASSPPSSAAINAPAPPESGPIQQASIDMQPPAFSSPMPQAAASAPANVIPEQNTSALNAARASTAPPQNMPPPIYLTPEKPQATVNATPPIAMANNLTASNIPAPAAKNGVAYTTEVQQEWFKTCMAGQKDPRVSKYMPEYCQCSWDRITATIPADNLISDNARVLDATNAILRSISSQCVIQVLASHGEIA